MLLLQSVSIALCAEALYYYISILAMARAFVCRPLVGHALRPCQKDAS